MGAPFLMTMIETSLLEMKTLARRFADKLFDDHVADDELTTYINLGIVDLTRLMQKGHGHEFFLKCVQIALDEDQTVYELPSDFGGLKRVDHSSKLMPATSVTESDGGGSVTTTYDVPIYEMDDVVSLSPYDFMNANGPHLHSLYPSVHRLRDVEVGPKYRILASRKVVEASGDTPVSSSSSYVDLIRLDRASSGYLYVWYWPKPARLTNDSDTWGMFMDFYEYPCLVAARMMLAKEESDTRAIDQRLMEIRENIEFFGANRDLEHEEYVADEMGGWRG